jgi:hypothetical protein
LKNKTINLEDQNRFKQRYALLFLFCANKSALAPFFIWYHSAYFPKEGWHFQDKIIFLLGFGHSASTT